MYEVHAQNHGITQ